MFDRRRAMMVPRGNTQPLGTIWYWTTDGLESAYYTTSQMASHEYSSKGIIKTVPSYKTKFGQWLQYSATVEKIQLPEGILVIESNALRNCASLATLNLPESITEIGNNVFYNDSLLNIETIHLPNLTGTFNAFGVNPHTKYITSLGNITNIALYACSGWSELERVVLPETLLTIDKNAFQNCTSLVSINLPESITTIGSNVFSGCTSLRIETIHLPNLTGTANALAADPHTKIVSDLGSITKLGIYCFDSWAYLESVTLPETLTVIDMRAFYHCTALTTIKILASIPPSLGTNALTGCTSLTHIYVPANSVETYKAATGWNAYASIISAISN